jgi:hypothetical protein
MLLFTLLLALPFASGFGSPVTALNETSPPYNAVSDGVADDPIPQTALNDTAATSRATVFIHDGVYYVRNVC